MPSAKELNCCVLLNHWLTPTVFELKFKTEQALLFQAGQFLSLVIPGAGPKGRDLRRAYSIASPPESTTLSLCVKQVEKGPGTTYLAELKPGDSFKIYAPYGDFIYKSKSNPSVFFIATGTGISPFRSMLFSQSFQENPPKNLTCLLGVQNESELLYQDELSQALNKSWIPALSRPNTLNWKGFKGRVTDYLRSLPASCSWKNTDYYLCGNGQMIEEVKDFLLKNAVLKTDIHQEVYYKS
jgi:NAD(P)H-flavin reductase